jgi:hypothetical protein
VEKVEDEWTDERPAVRRGAAGRPWGTKALQKSSQIFSGATGTRCVVEMLADPYDDLGRHVDDVDAVTCRTQGRHHTL